jgi:hypothetical protein
VLLAQLEIHPIIQIACAGLIVLFLWFLSRMLLECRATMRSVGQLQVALVSVTPLGRTDRRNGLQLEQIEETRAKCDHLSDPVRRWWYALEDNLERYSSPEGREGWFLGCEARSALPEHVLLGGSYHGSFHQAVPGLLTGLGLLATFVSILVALQSVDVIGPQGAEIVTGIRGLIKGLGGKFLSSILGLSLSVCFLVLERKWCERRLTKAYEGLLSSIGDLLPTISPTRIQLDLHGFAARQAVSLGNISAEIINKFVGVFQTQLAPAFAAGVSQELAKELQSEFRPTMQQMSETLDRLRSAIERLEAQKQESVAGELRGLIESLENSITTSLDGMGRTFHSSLTTAATEEFTGVANILKSTGNVLQDMNGQFDRMQAALQAVIEEARKNTDSQLSGGREQMEAMTRLMDGLMARLNESAHTNMGAVSASLTAVVNDLSSKVNKLSEDMVITVTKATRDSQNTANTVVEQAGAWSEHTAKRLESLVESIEVQSKDFATAGRTLLAAHDAMKETLVHNQKALESIAALTNRLQTVTTGVIGLGKTTEENQKAQLQLSALVKEATQNLRAAITTHESFLEQYRTVFNSYKSVFVGLDGQLKSVLDSINSGLQKYHQSVESNFRSIVAVTNGALPQIATTLKAEIDQLSDKLEELSDVLDKGIQGLRR